MIGKLANNEIILITIIDNNLLLILYFSLNNNIKYVIENDNKNPILNI